jgi:hypothetical protein
MTGRKLYVYPIVAWMILNILIMTLSLLSGDTADLNNYVEIVRWVGSIAGVLASRKWGYAPLPSLP